MANIREFPSYDPEAYQNSLPPPEVHPKGLSEFYGQVGINTVTQAASGLLHFDIAAYGKSASEPAGWQLHG